MFCWTFLRLPAFGFFGRATSVTCVQVRSPSVLTFHLIVTLYVLVAFLPGAQIPGARLPCHVL